MKISIIIPVFNSEKTIEHTLNSLISQSSKNFEVIIIDDGSNDNTFSFCKNYVKNYKNFFVFHQDNMGVSSARNKGIKLAKGEYLMFLDADDFLSNNTIEHILYAIQNNPDIIFFDYIIRNFNGKEENIQLKSNINKNDILVDILKGEVRGFVWNKVFKKDIIDLNDLKFIEDIKYCEDEIFLLDYLQLIEEVFYLNESLYYYIQHEDSATNKKGGDFYVDKFKPYFDHISTREYFKENSIFFLLKVARLRIYLYKKFNSEELNLKKILIKRYNFFVINSKSLSWRDKILISVARFDFLLRVYLL